MKRRVFLPTPQARFTGEFGHIMMDGVNLSDGLERSHALESSDIMVLDGHRISEEQAEPLVQQAQCLGVPVVVLDYGDVPQNVSLAGMPGISHWFKRSTVHRGHDIAPQLLDYDLPWSHITYCVREDTRRAFEALPDMERDIEVACFHESELIGSPGQHRRGQVAATLKRHLPGLARHHVGHVGKRGAEGRNAVSMEYIRGLARARILVTCQPDRWEGDYRLFEALACGPMVLCDRMLRPPKGLVDGEHFVFYDGLDDLMDKLRHFLDDGAACNRIASRGRAEALNSHRASHRMEAVCRKVLT